MSYPKDPLNEKDMISFTLLSVQTEKNYKLYSDKIVATCAAKSGTPLKIQKVCIDKLKEVIKAPSKKHPALHKFFSIKLLNKCVLKKNTELNQYVQSKILDRLSILAQFNNDPTEKSAQALLTRGKFIFGEEEKDTQSSANFLIILLDCIEKWALTFQFAEEEFDDAKSSNTSKASKETFYSIYTKLLDKGVKFPSTFKQEKKSMGERKGSDISSISNNQARGMGERKNSGTSTISNNQPQNVHPAKARDRSKSPIGAASASQKTLTSLTPDKKAAINFLKKKMQKVKEASKNAKKYSEKMEKPGSELIIADPVEIVTLKDLFTQSKQLGEESINELMSDEVQPHISNSEALLEKMFGYQEILETAINQVNTQIEHLKKIEQQVMLTSREGLRDKEFPDMKKSQSQMLHVPPKEKFATNVDPRKSMIMPQDSFAAQIIKDQENIDDKSEFTDFNFDASIAPTSTRHMNPYEFENFQNKEMFATQIQQQQNKTERNWPPPPDILQTGEFAPPIQMYKNKKPQEDKNEMIQPRKQQDEDEISVPAIDDEEPQIKLSQSPNHGQKSKMSAINRESKVVKKDSINFDDYNDPQMKVNPGDFGFEEPKSAQKVAPDNFGFGDPNSAQDFGFGEPKKIVAPNDFGFGEPNSAQKIAPDDFGFGEPKSAQKIEQNDFGFGEPKSAQKVAPDDFGFGESKSAQKVDDFGFEQPKEAAPGDFGFVEPKSSQPADFGFDPPNPAPVSFDDFAPPKPVQSDNFNFDNFDSAPPKIETFNDFNMDFNEPEKKQTQPDFEFGSDTGRFEEEKIEFQNSMETFGNLDEIQEMTGTAKFNKDQETFRQSQIQEQESPRNDENLYATHATVKQDSELSKKPSEMIMNNRVEQPQPVDDDDVQSVEVQSEIYRDPPVVSEPLDDSILCADSRDLEIEKRISNLRAKLKSTKISKWWLPNPQAEESPFQFNLTPQQLQPTIEIKNQMQEVEELQIENMKLRKENQEIKNSHEDEINSIKNQKSEEQQKIQELEFELSFQEKKVNEKQNEIDEKERMMVYLKETHEKEMLQKEEEKQRMQKEAQELLESQTELMNSLLAKAQEEKQEKQERIQNLEKVNQEMEKEKIEMMAQIAELKAQVEMSQSMPVAKVEQAWVPKIEEKKEILAPEPPKVEQSWNFAPKVEEEKKQEQKQPLKVDTQASWNFAPKEEEKKQSPLVNDMSWNMPPKTEETPKKIEQPLEQAWNFPPKTEETPKKIEQPLEQDWNFPPKAEETPKKTDSSLDQPWNFPPKSESQPPQSPSPWKDDISKSDIKVDFGNLQRVIPPTTSSAIKLDSGGDTPERQLSQADVKVDFNKLIQPDEQSWSRSSVVNNSEKKNQEQTWSKSSVVNNSEKKQYDDPFGELLGEIKPPSVAIQPQPSMKAQQQQQPAFQPQPAFQAPVKPFQQPEPPSKPQAPPIHYQASTSSQASFNSFQSTQFQTNISPSQPIPTAPSASTFQTAAQGMMSGLQTDLLRQKLQSFHLNSLIQGDKCVIYEDVNVKIGCIRKITPNTNGFVSGFKIFMRNHNQQQLTINNLQMQFSCTGNEQAIRIVRQSHALPLVQPLLPNQTLDMDVEIKWMIQTPLSLGIFKLLMVYELSNQRKSGQLPISLPINIMHFMTPFQQQSFEFKGLWEQIIQKRQNGCYSNQRSFILDLQKAQNMAKLKQILTLNNTSLAIIPEVELQPNWVCFAGQCNKFSAGTWILIKVMLTKDGNNCQLMVQACKDQNQISNQVFETIMGLIGK